ncbi:hypothetical protein [Pedobacter suwonensis]|uniref:hypothetical protein n=1 Tax=Pedobacter suwonensis TaxID=332999 RepID=UPI0011A19C6E|nr:hypothetical protein [Pedobacter suwonensis]
MIIFLERIDCAINNVIPVFRLYASASYLSLQGTAAPRANWQRQDFIFEVSRCRNTVPKPDGSGSPEE